MDVGTDADLQRKLCQFKDILRHVKTVKTRLVRNTLSQEGRQSPHIRIHTYALKYALVLLGVPKARPSPILL